MARWLAAILACVALPLAAASGLPAAHDLAADGRDLQAQGRIRVVLYSRTDCRWCEQANGWRVALSTDPDWRQRDAFRQVNIDADTPLVDFTGASTTHQESAWRQGIRFAPTVTFHDAAGAPLGEAIAGMCMPDFYGQSLERAIESAHETAKLKP